MLQIERIIDVYESKINNALITPPIEHLIEKLPADFKKCQDKAVSFFQNYRLIFDFDEEEIKKKGKEVSIVCRVIILL